MTTSLPWLLPCRPFVERPRRWGKAPDHSLEHREFELEQMLIFDELIARWCVARGYLQPMPTGDYVTSLSTNTGQIDHIILTTNFRALSRSDQLDDYLQRLEDNNDDISTGRIMNLLVEVNTRVDSRFLTIYINRLYRGLDAIADRRSDLSWDVVHERYPFLWLLYAIQQTLNRWLQI